ncbi:PepSY domain-containing protein [Alcanivorax marinus]|uniref:PepSY domain-containing protein n=2 Tax=Alloalcanivorax marinus TaxID=1177169 RepID=A0A9Q3UMA9_9GAMM|nr:PepSY domain-containing protein [Alloalcanivorax marinus]MBM7334978.1 PepSY domain-containing protein [Alloalcanivorax marinus]MCC4308017.1 PepSY domain-containing protein [Alloalcanivorax marinus]MCU5785107.1 propeptide PepSY amd peptidase M4 [Alloalcanivorax marinus]
MHPHLLFNPLGKAALAAFLACLMAPASALDVSHDEALRLRQSGEVQPFEQILAVAMARHPGASLLEAELERDDGALIYELEVLTEDGVVRELEIDARTGRVLEDEVDD